MRRALSCLWIDDGPERIRVATSDPAFASSIVVNVATDCDSAERLLDVGEEPDLVVLDVKGANAERTCQRALEGNLINFPWLVVSDLAREERIAKADVRSMSRSFIGFIERWPSAGARVIEQVARELSDGVAAPSRAYLNALVHDAAGSVEKLRWHFLESASHRTHTGESVDEVFDTLMDILTTVKLQ